MRTPQRGRTRASVAAALAGSVLLALIAGCGSDGSDDTDATPASSSVPAGLLGPDDVGQVTGNPVVSPRLFVPTLCGPDNARLWEGSDNRVVRYSRPDATVTIGTWVADDIAQVGLDELSTRMKEPACTHGATNPPDTRWSTTPLTGLPDGFVGFVTTVKGKVTDTATGTRSYARAYGLTDGRSVMVWVDGRTDQSPPPDLVTDLVRKQVAQLS